MFREWFDPAAVRRVGATPDYRFSLANERTFLAWVRTGLALVAGGLALAQFLPELRVPHLREALAVLLLIAGAAVALRGLNHWVRCEKAIRLGQDLPESRFPALLAVAVAAGAILLVVVVIVEGGAAAADGAGPGPGSTPMSRTPGDNGPADGARP